MELISTNKPDVPKKPDPKIEYNNKSYESYIRNGFADNIPRMVRGPYDQMQHFLNQVDIRKGPIERTVITMVRLRAVDWNTKKHERKEFIYYTEDWNANNWLGIPITKWRPSGHIEGKYTEVVTRPKLDERTGEHIDNVFAGTREVNYIQWSKKNVDEIIADSVHTDKHNIIYVIKFGAEDNPNGSGQSTRDHITYDQFVNWTWEKLYEWHTWPWDDMYQRARVLQSRLQN